MQSSADVSPSATPSATPLVGTHAPKFGTVIPSRIFVGGIAANVSSELICVMCASDIWSCLVHCKFVIDNMINMDVDCQVLDFASVSAPFPHYFQSTFAFSVPCTWLCQMIFEADHSCCLVFNLDCTFSTLFTRLVKNYPWCARSVGEYS